MVVILHSEILHNKSELESRPVAIQVCNGTFGNGPIPNCKPDLYQFYKRSPKTFILFCVYRCDAIAILIQFRKEIG